MAPGIPAGQDHPKPVVVHNYNQFMGGVDLKDQKLSMYLLERKCGIEWCITIFMHILNTSILNSYKYIALCKYLFRSNILETSINNV